MWLLTLAACRGQLEIVAEPDATRTGADGEGGPFGVARVEERAQVRVTEVLTYEITAPVDAGGPVAACPTVVLVQGGFVDTERYRWLAEHFATRGYAVVAPDYAADLALLQAGNTVAALDDALTTRGPAEGVVAGPFAVGGHSLGGVAAAIAWTGDDRFDGLLLLASFPADGTDVESRDAAVLSVVGTDDGSADLDAVADGAERFPGPTLLAEVDGLNHYGWTDAPTEGELAKDGEATRDVEEARRDALRLIDTWLDATLLGDADANARLQGDFPNVAVTR